MSKLATYNILDDTLGGPIKRVRLSGDGWWIEVSKHDERTLDITCGGQVVGSGVLTILPSVSNSIRVTNGVEHAMRVCEAAERLHEVDKANEALRLKEEKANAAGS